MSVVVDLVRAVARMIARPIVWIRDGEQDVRETYPELQISSGERAAVTGSLFMGSIGVDH